MKPTTAAAIAILCAASLPACSDPPPVAGTSSTPAAATPAAGSEAPKSGLIAGVGYDPKADPLVNPKSLYEPHDAAAATEDEWLFMTFDGDPKNLVGIMGTSTDDFTITSLLYDGPFTFDAKLTFKTNDYIVESLTTSEDKKVWTLKLKPGLKWQDGHPFTAHDIAYSYDLIMDPQVMSPQKQGTEELDTVRALDDLTVEYVHKAVLPVAKWNMNFVILPKHLYEKGRKEDPTLRASPYYAELNRNPVGNGPYKFVEWKSNDKIVFERWDEWPGPKVHFKRVIIRSIPDQNVQLLNFESGDVDEFDMNAKQFADATVRSEKFAKVGFKALGEQWQYSYIGWNQDGSNPFFTDVRVRHAMSHATNVKLMIGKVLYNLYPRCHGIFHPDSPMFSKEVKLLEYDPAKAAALLDEAGWKVSEQDGWRYKDGTKFSFTMMLPVGAPISVEVSAILQQDLKALGVEMKTQTLEWATWQERSRKHEFQANMASWGTGAYPDTSENIWHSKNYSQEGGRNYVGYKNPRVDELFELALHEFDEQKRMAYFAEIQKRVYDDQPYTFMWNKPILWAFNKRIRGVTISPRGVLHFDRANFDWWVRRDQRIYGTK